MNTPFAAPISEEIWDMKYRLKELDGTIRDISIQDTWRRIARALAACETDPILWEEQFFEVLSDFKFLPAGRIIAGAGAGRNVTLFNCYVMGTIPDSMNGIFDALKEAALTMQQGGGIGYDFSPLRPKSSPVKGVAADASGPLTFMDVWDAMCRTVMSAGSRRGAMMATMRCDHPDVLDFITAKQESTRLRMFNLSVLVTDAFMRAVQENRDWYLVHVEPPAHRGKDELTILDNEGDDGRTKGLPRYVHRVVKAVDLWEKIMRSTYDYAEPGVIFIDRINRDNNLNYCETIAATNPCFAGNQTLWTDQGLKTFAELEGQRVSVLTENQVGKLVYHPMDVFKTAENQEILRVTLDDGTTIDCTHTHEFFDLQRNRVEARDLLPGQRLASVYRHNANSKGYKRLTNGIDNPLEHHVPFEIIPDGFHVHHKNEIKDDNRPQNLELILGSDHNSYHMQGDRNPSITHPENNKLIQMDHSGSNNGRYREDLDDDDLQEMRKQGMSYIAIAQAVGCSKYTVMKRLGYERPNHKVVSVEPLMERQDVFCGTVGETHRFFLGCERGGVLVSNCGEQPLPPYGACLLGSINLTRFIRSPFKAPVKGAKGDYARIMGDELDRAVKIAVRMMDNVNDVSKFPLPQQAEESRLKRRIGLGVTGLADALAMLCVPYDSPEAIKVAEGIMRRITLAAYEASVELAKEKGAFPAFDAEKYLANETFASRLPDYLKTLIREHGIRNSHLTSIAPTGTISLVAGNVSSGIEPIFALDYKRKVTQKDGSKTEQRVQDYAVMAYHTAFDLEPDEDLPSYFVTAQDLEPLAHVRMQAAVQTWVDTSISKTINVPKDIPFAVFEHVYLEAYRLGCKGCTTYRPNDVTGSVISVEEKPVETVSQDDGFALTVRSETLEGKTYKVKLGGAPGFYITINDIVQGDSRRPFEVFINTKNPEHIAWSTALTMMISAIFRRPHDASFVVEELKSVFDPKGGGFWRGAYRPSVVAAIGQVIEDHMREIGYGSFQGSMGLAMPDNTTGLADPALAVQSTFGSGASCPKCFSFNIKRESGCETCQDCGHSKCG